MYLERAHPAFLTTLVVLVYLSGSRARPPGALAIKCEFDQHKDTFFQNLWTHESQNPLTMKSENSGFWKNYYIGWPKIRSKEDINDFVTLKIWTFDLALIKTHNCHLFESFSFSTKKPCRMSLNCYPLKCYKKHDKCAFFS